MATAHLISGLPCSGKTTYSMALSADADRVCFSLDCWLITSFGPYSIDSVGHDEHVRRVLVCRQLIWEVVSEFLRRDIDVILDDGFFLRAHRIEYVAMSKRFGAKAKTHFLQTPIEVVRARLEVRNSRLPRYNFRVRPEMPEQFVGLLEVPSEEEGAELVVVK